MIENEPQDVLEIATNSDIVTQQKFYPDLKNTVSLFFVFILNTILVAIPAIIVTIETGLSMKTSPLLKSLFNLVLYIAPLLITIRYIIKKSKKQQVYFQKISFNKIPLWLIPVIVIGTVALIIPISQISSWIPMPKAVQEFFERTFTKDLASIITVVIAAPVLEEIFCRGLVLRGLLNNYPPYKAIIISAIFFGAIHLNPWQAVSATLGGLFLGWVYYKTNSVIPGMIIHATINGTSTLFLFLPKSQRDLSGILGLPYYLLVCTVAILVFTICCIIIQRKVIPV